MCRTMPLRTVRVWFAGEFDDEGVELHVGTDESGGAVHQAFGCGDGRAQAFEVLVRAAVTDLESVMSSWWGAGEPGAGQAAVEHVAAVLELA